MRSVVSISVLLFAGFTASAQRDTVLKGSTIEVIQSYKPRVKRSPKPEWKPQLPPMDTGRPTFNIEVPQQTLYYSYNSTPLRPLALGKTANELPFQNYVKAGGGNLSTIYLDAGIGSIRGDDYETAIHLHSITQKGQIKDQHSSLSGLEADGTWHKAAGDIHVGLTGAHNRYAYYGYDHILHNYSYDSVKQAYTLARVAADLTNKEDSNTVLSYRPSVFGSYYGARFNTSELSFGFDAPVSYHLFDAVSLHLGLGGALTSYKADTFTTGNNYIQAAPGVMVHIKNFSGHALAGFAYGKGGSTYFLPDVVAAFRLPLLDMKLSFGWQAKLRQNTYEQLTTENPYMLNTYQVIQTKRDEIFFDFMGTTGNHLTYSGRVSWWNYFDLPTFLNDTGDQKAFYVWYQNVQALSFQGSVRYHVARSWSAGLLAEYYSFYKSSDQHVWHQPSLRIKADMEYRITPKLDAGAYVYVLGGMYARDVAFNAILLRTFADVGVNAEYSFIPRLSVFAQVNNLLNSKYQRWNGYQAYGINVYGGLRLKF